MSFLEEYLKWQEIFNENFVILLVVHHLSELNTYYLEGYFMPNLIEICPMVLENKLEIISSSGELTKYTKVPKLRKLLFRKICRLNMLITWKRMMLKYVYLHLLTISVSYLSKVSFRCVDWLIIISILFSMTKGMFW